MDNRDSVYTSEWQRDFNTLNLIIKYFQSMSDSMYALNARIVTLDLYAWMDSNDQNVSSKLQSIKSGQT